MSTALTQLYYHTMARPRVVSEKESLLEGESGPTPAEKTLPTPCQQDRSWPSLEDGNGDLYLSRRMSSEDTPVLKYLNAMAHVTGIYAL